MANTLRFKRGLVSGIPTAALGEPLFTTDTFDLYIGNGTGNTRFQKYIASGTTSQLLRGDGSLLTMPIVLTSPSNGQVLKYDGTNWVNSADAGVTGSGAAGQVTYWGSSSTITGSNNLFWDATNNRLGIGTNTPTQIFDLVGGNMLSTWNQNGFTNFNLVNTTNASNSAVAFRTTSTSGYTELGKFSPSIGSYKIISANNGYLLNSTIGDLAIVNDVSNGVIKFAAGGATNNQFLIDAVGNIGINTTPSGWDNNQKVLQVSNGSFYAYSDGTSMVQNAYFFGSWRYIASSKASGYYTQVLGSHQWFNAPSGTAGNTITFTQAMTLNANGRLLLGSTSDNGLRFQVTGDGFFSGSVGIGNNNLTQFALRIGKNIEGATISYGAAILSTIQSGVTSQARIFYSEVGTAAASFTLGELNHYYAVQGTFGAGSTVTNQYGFRVFNNLTGATNNYGFYGDIASGTGRWNLYMNGTANNYMAGSLGIGTTSLTGNNLAVIKNITGTTTAFNIQSAGVIQSDVTGYASYYRAVASTQATTFTLSTLANFSSGTGAFGAGSTTTNFIGFHAQPMTGGVNNYGFYGEVASGTGRWNLYMVGSAHNYLANNLGINNTTPLTKLHISAGHIFANNGTGVNGGANIYLGSNDFNNSTFWDSAPGIGAVYSATSGVASDLGFYTYAGNANSRTERARIFYTGNIGINTTTDAGFRLDVNGTMRVSGASTFVGNLTVTRTTSSPVNLNASDGSNNTSTEAQVQVTANSTQGYFVALGPSKTPYKIITSGGVALYKSNTSGDLSILNDNTVGSITMAAGGSSTAHLTIASTGAATFSSSVTAAGNITSSDGTSSTIVQTSTNAPRIVLIDGRASGRRFDLGSLQSGAGTFSITDATAGLARFTIAGDGTAIFSGNVGIGGTGASYKLDVTGEARVSNAIAIGTTPDTNKPFKILKNINGTVGINFENTSTGSLAFSAIQMGTDVTGGTKFTNIVYSSSGVAQSGVYYPDGTSIINIGTGGLNFYSQGAPIRMFNGGGNGVLKWEMVNDSFINHYTGTAPTTSATDGYRQYSADVTAGNAAPHFRTENGAVIKLYQETTGVGNAIFSQGGGNSVLDDSTFDGYTLRQIVKALRNQGILQ